MGWLVAALSGMQEEQLVQSHGREGADQQDRVFVFAFLQINSPPVSATGAWYVLALASHGIVPGASCLCDQSRQHQHRCLSSGAPPRQHRVTLHCLGAPCIRLRLLTAPALAFCTKPGPSMAFTARGTFPTTKAGDSSSLSCGPLCYTTHLQPWIPPEMSRNVSPCHECLTSNVRARDSLITCLL